MRAWIVLGVSPGFAGGFGRTYGQTTFVVGPGQSPALAGLTLHHAYGVLANGTLDFVSNAEALALVP